MKIENNWKQFKHTMQKIDPIFGELVPEIIPP